jgi:hypothetical protein
MALNIADGIVTVAANAAATVMAADADRVAAAIQNQSRNTVRFRLGAVPTVTAGMKLEPGETVSMGSGAPGSGNSTDFYTGDVQVFNMGNEPADIFFCQADNGV